MRFLLGTVLVVMAAVAVLASYGSHSYYNSVLNENKTVILVPGTGARGTLEMLHEQGALPAPWKIAIPVFFSRQYRNFKAGEYAFAAGMTPEQILSKIARGEVVVHKITIPEGFTSTQVAFALLQEKLLKGGLPPSMLEGRLFPNTYHFQREETREAVVSRMKQAMDETLARLWAARSPDLPLATPQEALILASIVEKETSVPEERPLVAAVYLNRLKKGMMLQADPTVVYGIDPSGELDRSLTLADLNRDTPYNTYTRTGLPPGPICNPGLAAIEAVLHPAETNVLYFVATGDGGHRFAETHAEHQKNVAAYRKAMQPEPVKQAPAKKESSRKR